MSVTKGNRHESGVEFEHAYFKLYEDGIRLVYSNFGGNKDRIIEYSLYIKVVATKVLQTINDIGKYIRIANSIYPVCKLEYEERRISQDKAIGLCYDLLTKYQMIMKLLYVNDNKYVTEIQNIKHEINCLKKWRSSDNKRFHNIG